MFLKKKTMGDTAESVPDFVSQLRIETAYANTIRTVACNMSLSEIFDKYEHVLKEKMLKEAKSGYSSCIIVKADFEDEDIENMDNIIKDMCDIYNYIQSRFYGVKVKPYAFSIHEDFWCTVTWDSESRITKHQIVSCL